MESAGRYFIHCATFATTRYTVVISRETHPNHNSMKSVGRGIPPYPPNPFFKRGRDNVGEYPTLLFLFLKPKN